MIKVNLLKKPDISVALFGLGKNKGVTSNLNFEDFSKNYLVPITGTEDEEFMKKHETYNQMFNVANRLSNLSAEHRKFLRQIEIAVEITMPRYWWSEFDTYKIGTTAQSESTMHTILKQKLTLESFSDTIDEQLLLNIIGCINTIKSYNSMEMESEKIVRIKQILPESFLQCRVVTMNYEVFANIYKQRINHRLPEWKFFCTELLKQLPYKNWITKQMMEE